MKTTNRQLFCFLLPIAFVACTTVKEVAFKTPVDTTTKRIEIQTKQTYELKDMGVFASNDFDGARLNGFVKENDSTAIVVINPENTPINNSGYYAFNTWSTTPKTFYFKFQYPEGYNHRYIPKLKIGNDWSILDSSFIFKKDSIVTIKLNLSKEPVVVAAQVIESSSDVKKWYTDVVKGKEYFVKLKSVGKSTKGRDLPVLDIYKGDKKNKDIIILLTRQHPPEVTGYYAFQSFLKTILNDSGLSKEFLDHYRILAFPILNPDGVDMGHWRHNAGGVDLNRDWSSYKQPEIKKVVSFIDKTSKKDSGKIILGLDFHSTWHDVFYTNKTRKETTLPNFVSDWFAALEKNIPNYKVNEEAGNSTKPVSKGWFLYGHDAVGITYEIGDATPKKSIELFGSVSAEQMMSIILTK
ncbi:Zinc carboxypeptidase [Flavobacterium gillisiae]|uniref:Zinc carboxypeptidase n=1 Tax=Flavobacterium gillisiae TaxID=150146 RepID=A0A1H4CPL1_9FLAO|nr:M14 family metallopeptidase [Flavobacterium gillisiae]SEA62259.1 Zinc carboxypeptidase [Flavobacterium gillisiae]